MKVTKIEPDVLSFVNFCKKKDSLTTCLGRDDTDTVSRGVYLRDRPFSICLKMDGLLIS